ncbi:hypothetical protein KIW84_022592 [Lathyrus oleraceus]|uniref:Uncharacterized protein n=1 Tax=Pisum sativum TaxID=3888 RepID=A0A9D4YGM8_PEA|nr:hypothetical protein KIW84_022592 [Pisum sativum]
MEETKSIDRADMVLGLFLDIMTTYFPNQRTAQRNQKLKQKQISQNNKDQEGRRPRNDPIPMSYAHLLPILVNTREIVPKQIEHARFSYSRKHDPHAICGYHARHVGHSIENCYSFKGKVQELINRNLLCFTPMTAKVPTEKEFEYKGPPIHVQVPPPMVQPAVQYPSQGYRPGMLLAYPGELSFTVVSPQYAYNGTLYPIWSSLWSYS